MTPHEELYHVLKECLPYLAKVSQHDRDAEEVLDRAIQLTEPRLCEEFASKPEWPQCQMIAHHTVYRRKTVLRLCEKHANRYFGHPEGMDACNNCGCWNPPH